MKNTTKLQVLAIAASVMATAGLASADTIVGPLYTGSYGSDYTYVGTPDPAGPGGQWAEGTYAFTTNPQLEHGLWHSFGTPSGGVMMTVNGAVDANERVWYTTVSTPGTYDFETLLANSYPDSPADLQLQVNGVSVGADKVDNNGVPGWQLWEVSGLNLSAGSVLSIIDLNTAAGGNDFALASVPDGATTASLLGGALVCLAAFRRKLVG